ncbi:sugar phosphate isomerase/epimerase family protein [Kitasatospora sp. DSM 101779]|uniref:sugar phosphate isomerase/epimerase family protein n=1 Tax=Kitasatospora sp. DSM 101779 TaxID=2853165 RepID=UPI0021D9B5B9|nr:sugar phosphate isomerase/epimerase family protein [Kitasatospora sp. DSM 101779]MCU7826540.1 sugar phosphate isomerase/epimerase [Kitasatospora sp. DSM 101779]
MSASPAPAPAPRIDWAGIGDEAAPDLTGQLAALARLGWRHLELRTVDGQWIADLPEDAVRRIADRIADRGVRVVGTAARIGNWAGTVADPFDQDLAELTALGPRCAALGTRFVRVMSYPNAGLPESEWRRRVLQRLGALAELAGTLGLVLLHENCSGWAGGSAERMLDLVTTVDSPALRLLLDTGNGVPYGYDSHRMLLEVADHVAHVHVKDAVGGGERTEYVPPGEGGARVADSLRLLLDRGWSGAWSLEPHLHVRPHEGRPAADGGAESGFVRAGLALARLVEQQLLPSATGWRAVPGGLRGIPAAAIPGGRRGGPATRRDGAAAR